MIDELKPGIDRMFTHVRVVAADTAPLSTPQIRALARLDVEVHAHAVSHCSPVARRFATLADERSETLAPCTIAIIAQEVWTPQVPAALVCWGAETWDVFTPAITRGVARIDMCKIARLVWRDEYVRDPEMLATRTGFRRQPALVGRSDAHAIASRVAAIADLFGAVVSLVSDDLIARAAMLVDEDTRPFLNAVLGELSGDTRLEALVRLSTVPLRPAGELPSPWDDPPGWFAMSGEDLAWFAGAVRGEDGYDEYARDEARLEIARRRERDAALLRPRLLRQPTRD
jgi:hypothetical protein